MNKVDWIVIFVIVLSVASVFYYVENFTGENREIMGSAYIRIPEGCELIREDYDHYTLDNGSSVLDIRIHNSEGVDYLINNYVADNKNKNLTFDTLVINSNDKINKIKLVENNTTTVKYYFNKNNITYVISGNDDVTGTYGTNYRIKELFNSMI